LATGHCLEGNQDLGASRAKPFEAVEVAGGTARHQASGMGEDRRLQFLLPGMRCSREDVDADANGGPHVSVEEPLYLVTT
jgi:hypothetical protein